MPVPKDGSPTYIEPLKFDDDANHPILVNSGPDTPASCEDTAGFRVAAENVAENEGISLAAARQRILSGCEDLSTYVRPRSETGSFDKWQSGVIE